MSSHLNTKIQKLHFHWCPNTFKDKSAHGRFVSPECICYCLQISPGNSTSSFLPGHPCSTGLFFIMFSQKWISTHQNCLKFNLTTDWIGNSRICHKIHQPNKSLLFGIQYNSSNCILMSNNVIAKLLQP